MVGRGKVLTRLDPRFHQALRAYSKLVITNGQPLKKLISAMFSGGTPNTQNPAYWTGTIPWISPKDFSEFEMTSAIDGVSEIAIQESSAKIAPKDSVVLVVRSGVLVHTIPIAVTGTALAINQDVKAMTCRSDVLPHYLAMYFRVFQDWLLPVITKFGATVQSINTAELKNLEIPVPPIAIQSKVVSLYLDSLAAAKGKRERASMLLAGIDDYLLAELGITLPPEPENTLASRIFTAQRRELEQRFDPAYFSSRFARIQNTLEAVPHIRLRDIAYFSSEQWDQESGFGDEFPYLEISAINTETGETGNIDSIPKRGAPSRARMLIREDDILVSTTRPNRGAITFVRPESPALFVASTGFSVIRHVDKSKMSKEFLLILLRSRLCLLQFEQRSSGGNYPAITQSELGRILLPSVAATIQDKIVADVQARHAEAKRLRQQAETDLETAKRHIEAMLLGEAA